MKLSEWPIYIDDYNGIDCNHPGCDTGLCASSIGRRTTFRELAALMIAHAKNEHDIELTP